MDIEFLIKQIKLSDMSIVRISRKSGISRATIHSLLKKRHEPTSTTILKVGKAIGLSKQDICKMLDLNED
jgi:DNA-binding phage protein